jgi:hypothetical protein
MILYLVLWAGKTIQQVNKFTVKVFITVISEGNAPTILLNGFAKLSCPTTVFQHKNALQQQDLPNHPLLHQHSFVLLGCSPNEYGKINYFSPFTFGKKNSSLYLFSLS